MLRAITVLIKSSRCACKRVDYFPKDCISGVTFTWSLSVFMDGAIRNSTEKQMYMRGCGMKVGSYRMIKKTDLKSKTKAKIINSENERKVGVIK